MIYSLVNGFYKITNEFIKLVLDVEQFGMSNNLIVPTPDVELGDIMILSFIVILKCHDNRNRREIFNIVISPTRYYRKYCDYRKIHCSEMFISVKYFQLISTILVPVALLSDIVIISIIVIITLMIYRDMKFLLSPIPTLMYRKSFLKCHSFFFFLSSMHPC